MGLEDIHRKGENIILSLSPEAVDELERLAEISDMSRPEVLRCSLTTFKRLIDAYEEGAEVFIEYPNGSRVKIARPY